MQNALARVRAAELQRSYSRQREKGAINKKTSKSQPLKSATNKRISHDTFFHGSTALTTYWQAGPGPCEYAFSTICLACLSASCRSSLLEALPDADFLACFSASAVSVTSLPLNNELSESKKRNESGSTDTDCNVALGKVIEIVRVSSCTLISALARSTPARIS